MNNNNLILHAIAAAAEMTVKTIFANQSERNS